MRKCKDFITFEVCLYVYSMMDYSLHECHGRRHGAPGSDGDLSTYKFEIL